MAKCSVLSVTGWAMALLLLLVLLGTRPSYGEQCQPHACMAQWPDISSGQEIKTKEQFLHYCTEAPKFLKCYKDALSKCNDEEIKQRVKEAEKILAVLESGCNSLTANRKCDDAVDCFLSEVKDVFETCRSFSTLVTCLEQKAKTSSCYIDESHITFAKVKDIVTQVCPDQECLVAFNAANVTEVPDMNKIAKGGENLTVSMTDLGFYCRTMSGLAKSYSSYRQQCGFSHEYVDKMNATYLQLKTECPTGPVDGPLIAIVVVSAVVSIVLVIVLLIVVIVIVVVVRRRRKRKENADERASHRRLTGPVRNETHIDDTETTAGDM